MANECACVLCTLSRLTGECLLGRVCMNGVGLVGMRRTGRALVARVHILRHRVLKQMKGQAPHTVHRPDSFPLNGQWLRGGPSLWWHMAHIYGPKSLACDCYPIPCYDFMWPRYRS